MPLVNLGSGRPVRYYVVMKPKREVLIAPSVLAADFGNLAEAVRTIERSGGDWVHLDVMDGSFVPNITIGAQMVAALRPHSRLPFDVHLMINRPELHIESFVRAGTDILTIHLESTVHVHRVLSEVRRLGKKPGIAIVPSTPAELLQEVLTEIDLVLVMTVNPGFGGQKLIERTLEKVRYLHAWRLRNGLSYRIEVDGGINRKTCRQAIGAGADVIVAGSAVFNGARPEEEIEALRCAS